MGVPVRETMITRNHLYDADEVFLTGTAAEVTPVREIDGYAIGGRDGAGPLSQRMAELYDRCVRGEIAEFEHWLHYV
jgi:branched-chain amino acid aminotransferase